MLLFYYMSYKEEYLELCANESLPLFMQGWWLDATCNAKGSWNCFLVKENDIIVGAIAYYVGTRMGMKFSIMPQLTQTGGVWMHSRVVHQPELSRYIIAQIEQHFKKNHITWYYQQFDPRFNSYQYFDANKYAIKERTTFRISNTSNIKAIRNSFHKNKMRQLKKSERNLVSISYDCSGEMFYDFRKKCLEQKGKKIVYSKDYFLNLYNKSIHRNQGRIIVAKNMEGKIIAGVYLVWDKNVCYYLIPSYDSNFSKLGGMAAVTYHSIIYSSKYSEIFDFEGSMEPSIALSYKQFGGEEYTYYSVERFFNPCMKWISKIYLYKQRFFK